MLRWISLPRCRGALFALSDLRTAAIARSRTCRSGLLRSSLNSLLNDRRFSDRAEAALDQKKKPHALMPKGFPGDLASIRHPECRALKSHRLWWDTGASNLQRRSFESSNISAVVVRNRENGIGEVHAYSID